VTVISTNIAGRINQTDNWVCRSSEDRRTVCHRL